MWFLSDCNGVFGQCGVRDRIGLTEGDLFLTSLVINLGGDFFSEFF